MDCRRKIIPMINNKNAQCHDLDSTNIKNLDNCKNYAAEYSESNAENATKHWYVCRKSKGQCDQKGLGLNKPLGGWLKQSKKCNMSVPPTNNVAISIKSSPTIDSRPRLAREYRKHGTISPSAPKTLSRTKTRRRKYISNLESIPEGSQGGKKNRKRRSLRKRKSKKSRKSRKRKSRKSRKRKSRKRKSRRH